MQARWCLTLKVLSERRQARMWDYNTPQLGTKGGIVIESERRQARMWD